MTKRKQSSEQFGRLEIVHLGSGGAGMSLLPLRATLPLKSRGFFLDLNLSKLYIVKSNQSKESRKS